MKSILFYFHDLFCNLILCERLFCSAGDVGEMSGWVNRDTKLSFCIMSIIAVSLNF